ncbi:MAG: hypothetical protein ACRDBG_02585 [Waterburya sp.]
MECETELMEVSGVDLDSGLALLTYSSSSLVFDDKSKRYCKVDGVETVLIPLLHPEFGLTPPGYVVPLLHSGIVIEANFWKTGTYIDSGKMCKASYVTVEEYIKQANSLKGRFFKIKDELICVTVHWKNESSKRFSVFYTREFSKKEVSNSKFKMLFNKAKRERNSTVLGYFSAGSIEYYCRLYHFNLIEQK